MPSPSKQPLLELLTQGKYLTDKYDLGYIEHFYNHLLPRFREKPITFLEIGAWQGESIRLWKDFLHHDSTIVAADINPFPQTLGTHSIVGDLYSDRCVELFPDGYFDLIIDDGPHTFESFVLLLTKYFTKVKSGGTIVIEDVINSNWVKPLVALASCLGYSQCEVTDMTGKQRTAHLQELWKNGLFIITVTK